MATYKVIQDIEAEDKLLGPLTLRQFVYAIIVFVSGFIAFRLAIAGLWYISLIFLPIIVFFAVLAAPFGHDQSSEVWLLAKIRFSLKPRRRIWDQSGMKELVTVTAPKKIEKIFTKDMSQTEVRSRLQALANTIDSRGWAVKNVNINEFSEPSYVASTDTSDRLLDPTNLPQDVPYFDVNAADDMLDERTNPKAQQLNQLMEASSEVHKQQAIASMQPSAKGKKKKQDAPADYWFLNGPVNPAQQAAPGYAAFGSQVVLPGQADPPPVARAGAPTPDEEAIIKKVKAEKGKHNIAYGRMHTIQPLSAQPQAPPAEPPAKTSKSKKTKEESVAAKDVNPAIIELANNDDLNVATIARQANKANDKNSGNDEVVISLR